MTEYCVGPLFLQGFEPLARAFIEAIPQEQRARVDRVVFAGPDSLEEMGHFIPDEHRERGIVYLVAFKGNRYAFCPVTRPLVEDADAGVAAHILESLELHLAEMEAGA